MAFQHSDFDFQLPAWHPNDQARWAIETIRSYGWAVTASSGANDHVLLDGRHARRSCVYTTGLVLQRIPELLVYGLHPECAVEVLDEFAELLPTIDWRTAVNGSLVMRSQTIDRAIRLLCVHDTSPLRTTRLVFPKAPALQVVWSDADGRFIWETGTITECLVQETTTTIHESGESDDQCRRWPPGLCG